MGEGNGASAGPANELWREIMVESAMRCYDCGKTIPRYHPALQNVHYALRTKHVHCPLYQTGMPTLEAVLRHTETQQQQQQQAPAAGTGPEAESEKGLTGVEELEEGVAMQRGEEGGVSGNHASLSSDGNDDGDHGDRGDGAGDGDGHAGSEPQAKRPRPAPGASFMAPAVPTQQEHVLPPPPVPQATQVPQPSPSAGGVQFLALNRPSGSKKPSTRVL